MNWTRDVNAFSVFVIATTVAFSSPALAQGTGMKAAPAVPASGGHATFKVVAENDKVTVQDVVAHPGDTVPMAKRLMRVQYIIAGGTVERTYEDGTTETVNDEAGQVKILNITRAYSVKVIGTKTIHQIIVTLK